MYLIIPASNIGTRADELDHIEQWSAVNNLKLNRRRDRIRRFPTETLSSSTVTSVRRRPGIIEEDAGHHCDGNLVYG